jgi:hypothetical protein
MNMDIEKIATPRTDAAQFGTGRVTVDFAKQLERELYLAKRQRDRAMFLIERSAKAHQDLAWFDDIEELKAKIVEMEGQDHEF